MSLNLGKYMIQIVTLFKVKYLPDIRSNAELEISSHPYKHLTFHDSMHQQLTFSKNENEKTIKSLTYVNLISYKNFDRPPL